MSYWLLLSLLRFSVFATSVTTACSSHFKLLSVHLAFKSWDFRIIEGWPGPNLWPHRIIGLGPFTVTPRPSPQLPRLLLLGQVGVYGACCFTRHCIISWWAISIISAA